MKIYTIATVKVECFGHGDYRAISTIRKEESRDFRGTDKFPPVFKTLNAARLYLDTLSDRDEKRVVELELVD